MRGTLNDALLQSGAVIDGASGLPLHFGAPKAELHAALNVCTVADRSPLARLIGDGPDLADLLNRLSTNAVDDLEPGHGAATVLTNAKGRIIERLFVTHLGDAGLLLVGGTGRAGAVLDHLKKFTFAEQTGLRDCGGDYGLLSIGGPLAQQALTTAGLEIPPSLGAVAGAQDGIEVHVLGHDGYSADGYSVLVANEQADSLWQTLVLAVSNSDGRAAGELALEVTRVRRGIPASGSELNENHNPLEAGLWDAVAFDKGCYVGQEVVARLNTYDKVARRLVGLRIPQDQLVVAGGTKLYSKEKEAGVVTSVAGLEGVETVALAYVKTRAADIGDRVQLGAADGPTVSLDAFPMKG
jgi:folate-binding protein YgfZ